MGYESRIYVCDYHAGTEYCETIAAVKLCTMGNFCDIFKKDFREDKVFFCGIGETHDSKDLTADEYDEKIKYAELEDVIQFLEKKEAEEHYRRLPFTIAMLKSLQERKSEWEHLIVVHYGH